MTDSVPPNIWDERYRSSPTSFHPCQLVTETAQNLAAGRALELACGTGGNALWLAERGWQVTAVDSSAVAVDLLQAESVRRGIRVNPVIADLEAGQFVVAPNAWDLVIITKYLQRDLFESIKHGVVPGGMVISSALLQLPDQTNSQFRVKRGELRAYFSDWEILSYREPANGAIAAHSLAEIVVRRPAC